MVQSARRMDERRSHANHGSSTERRESPGGVGNVAAVATCASLILQAGFATDPSPRRALTSRRGP